MLSIALFIGFGILVMAISSVVMGVFMLRRVQLERNQKKYILGMTICAYLWCSGYGIMNLAASTTNAYIGRLSGLVGVYCFVVMAQRFFAEYCGLKSLGLKILWYFDWFLAILSIYLMSRPQEASFVRTQYGTTFYASDSIWRKLVLLFLLFNAVSNFIILNWGRKRVVFRRQKKIIDIMIILEVQLLALSSMDGIFPILGQPSFPASCIGVWIAMIMLYFLGLKHNAFTITKSNVASYIFEKVDTPVLILDENMNILMASISAEKFFDTKMPEESKKFYDLFEITKDDAKQYFDNLLSGLDEGMYKLIDKKNKAYCEIAASPVFDEFSEPLCIVAFINDKTKDHEAFSKLKNVKSSLESELEEKTEQMETITLQAVSTIANFIDSKEEYTIGHSTRVARYAQAIATELGWSKEDVTNIYYVGLLHDIGKIGVPYEILNKPSRLTDAEYEKIKKHTVIGAEILKEIKSIKNVEMGALYHHEKYNGTGYPKGLAGDEIPLVARVIGIADAYDAMTSNRHYRKHLKYEIVRKEIVDNSGIQFDPILAKVVVKMIDEGKLQAIEYKKINNDAIEMTGEESMLTESSFLMAKVLGNEIKNSRQEAEIDYLTQIWNRGTGEKHINEYLRVGDGALLIIDLDNFKGVNDNYGHLMGDYVLKVVADILKKYSGNEFLCRMGGDEFLLFMRDVTEVEKVKKFVQSLLYNFNSRAEEDKILSNVSLSIGIALSAIEGRDYANLFRCADRALYFVKQNGKSSYSFHNRAELDNNENTGKLELGRILHMMKNKTNYNGAFKLEYQQFLHMHEFVEKYAMRNHQCVQLVLLTVNYNGDENFEQKEEIMNCLENSVTNSLRGVDVSTRFSNSQILITLVDTEANNVELVMRRILKQFLNVYRNQNVKISYDAADITKRAS